jgi:membrane peptidoglycan carboxypeptidase
MPLRNGNGPSFRAYRAYRMPHRRGRLSRRPGSAGKLGTTAGVLTAIFITFGIFAGSAMAAFFGYFAADLPAAHELATVPIPLSTYLYDRTGEHLLYTLEEQRRELVTLKEVPLLMQNATIAIEDHSFWSNPGIDPGGIVRAFQVNLARGSVAQGGSTITQQLIKTRLLGDEPTVTRKIKEAILAIEATRTFSKQEILEMYLSQIFYGNQSYGLKSAAKTYFGVADLNTLTLGQMALLAGLPQAPSDYDPVQNPVAAAARRALVLDAMVEYGFVTQEQADAAKAEPIKVTPAQTSLYAPHFTFRAREQLINLLGEKASYRGGYRVYTTLDYNMQQLAEKQVTDHVNGLKFANVGNAALITLDPTTGEILAYVGSKDYYDHSPKVQGDYDVAGIGLRQPGSTFKLFTYLTGMLKGGMTASTVLNDIEFSMPDGSGKAYAPKDATKEQHGPTTIRQALRESLNLPALNVTRMVGVDAIIDTIHQLGINREFDRSRLGLSFGIGAGEMRLLDMASAYQVVANYGRRIEPTFISKIIDSSGKLVVDYTNKPESKQVIDERYAWVMTNILKDNTDPVHGSFVFGPFTTIGRPAALKTGTTDNLQDVLAIGYTPTRLTAIWMGNSDNTEMNGISSALGPGILWRDYMKIVTGGLPPDDFKRPAGIVDKVVCVNPALTGGNGSGLLPGPNCPSNYRWTESYVQGTEPTSDDRNVYLTGGCYKINIPFSDWSGAIGKWAGIANAGGFSYGRFNWNICGYAAQPSGSPSGSPGGPSPTPPQPGQSGPPRPTPQPTPPPKPTDKNQP